MFNFIERLKGDSFSLGSIREVIFNISAVFFITIIFYVLTEFGLIRSDFLVFIILMISIFAYFLFARIFFGFPLSLKDKILAKSDTYATVHREYLYQKIVDIANAFAKDTTASAKPIVFWIMFFISGLILIWYGETADLYIYSPYSKKLIIFIWVVMSIFALYQSIKENKKKK